MLRSRRRVLKAGLAGLASALPAWGCAARGAASTPVLGFSAVPVSSADSIVVPPGYRAQVLYRWGDATGIPGTQPAFRLDAGNSAAEQALQAGMHHDAVEFFALPEGGALLAINHEYTDDGLLHRDGMATWNAEKVRKSQAAHGVSIVEARFAGGAWEIVRPSRYARRITAYTPMRMSGPAAASKLLGGGEALGTISNCAGGRTPWDTYLACEENFNFYFVGGGAVRREEMRYGIGGGSGYRWHEFDARFDARRHPAEPNRFGWVVEIDPYDPRSQPVKRTALGRFKHEGAMVALARDRRIVVYMGDDERFEYIYKFVSDQPYRPGMRDLLDEGALYAARFGADGTGQWLALPRSAEALVYARFAADAAGATRMDRPEWIAVHPATHEVYVSLTNNPRANNIYGHIVKWREEGADAAALAFRWEVFVLAGEDKGFGSPDGLWFDPRGVLWIQTDVSGSSLNRGPYARLGNNQMLAADIATGEIRRFLTGPASCEVTGLTAAPDGRTLFVNVQHPGETRRGRNSDPGAPRAVSNWPDYHPDGRPRSATLAIRREDGGPIGA